MRKILIFSIFWFIINLIQSSFTEIINDEAYYWVYSNFLDWGYFDHPPLIALLIKVGYLIFGNELGVRLLSCMLGAGSVFLILYMIKDEVDDIRLPMLLLFAIPLLHLHVAGFLAIPDIPLVFFTALFFFLYKKFLSDSNFLIIILLSLTIALMFYSKYHSFLIIGFTVLSNLKLLRRRDFWLVAVLAVILFIPHINWQFKHDFASFRYHLVDRSESFNWRHLVDYIVGQIFLLGPVTGGILLYFGIRQKADNPFHKALKFSFIGFFLFFLASSIRGHVEAHWTAAGYVPLLLYTLPLTKKLDRVFKKRIYLPVITIVLIFLVRIAMVHDFAIIPDNINNRFHGKEAAVRTLAEKSGGKPVVYTNTYKEASVFWFYTGITSYTYNNLYYHRTQYELLGLEGELTGQDVLFVTKHGFPGCDTIYTSDRRYIIHEVDYFCAFNRVEVHPPDYELKYYEGEEIDMEIRLYNPTSDTICFDCPCTHAPNLLYTYYDLKKLPSTRHAELSGFPPKLMPGSTETIKIRIKAPEQPGEFRVLFSIGMRQIHAGINGRPVKMTVLSRSTENSG